MLGQTWAVPVWVLGPLVGLAVLGAKGYIVDPLVKRSLSLRERDAKTRLNTTLTRPLPKVLKVPRRVLMERLLNDPKVQNAIDTAAAETSREDAEKEARAYVDELMPSFFALFYFHIGYWLARRYLRSMYDISVARQLPKGAYGDIPEDASIVLVGNHRSNIDVGILSYLAARTSMISFAAGEWAAVWPVNRIMHMSGCYIIRREAQNRLYKTVLARYIRMMIGAQMPQGIFLEGGLSRDGAIQPVKLGLMRYILAGLGENDTKDVVFIPVSFNYDRVPEDMTLLAHQDQGFQQKSKFYTIKSTLWHSFGLLGRLLKIHRQSYGQASVSFGTALSARKWLEARDQSVEALDDDGRKAIVAPIANEIIGQIGDMIPVLPVNLVSKALQEIDQPTVRRADLRRRILNDIEALRARDIPLSFDEIDDSTACERGLKVLVSRGVVSENNRVFTIDRSKIPLLGYYARTIAHYFTAQETEEETAVRLQAMFNQDAPLQE